MDEREHEIVARAIAEADGFTGFSWPDGHFGAIAKAAIHTLDSHRAKNGGEELQRLRIAAHRQLRAASDDGWDLSPLAEYITAMESLISSLRSAIAEKDEALRQAISFIEGLSIQPILDADDCEMSVSDISQHAAIELKSIRARSRISDGAK